MCKQEKTGSHLKHIITQTQVYNGTLPNLIWLNIPRTWSGLSYYELCSMICVCKLLCVIWCCNSPGMARFRRALRAACWTVTFPSSTCRSNSSRSFCTIPVSTMWIQFPSMWNATRGETLMFWSLTGARYCIKGSDFCQWLKVAFYFKDSAITTTSSLSKLFINITILFRFSSTFCCNFLLKQHKVKLTIASKISNGQGPSQLQLMVMRRYPGQNPLENAALSSLKQLLHGLIYTAK